MHGLDYLFLSDSLVPLNQAHPGRSKDGAHSSSQVKEIEMNASNSWQSHVKPVVRDARATKVDGAALESRCLATTSTASRGQVSIHHPSLDALLQNKGLLWGESVWS